MSKDIWRTSILERGRILFCDIHPDFSIAERCQKTFGEPFWVCAPSGLSVSICRVSKGDGFLEDDSSERGESSSDIHPDFSIAERCQKTFRELPCWTCAPSGLSVSIWQISKRGRIHEDGSKERGRILFCDIHADFSIAERCQKTFWSTSILGGCAIGSFSVLIWHVSKGDGILEDSIKVNPTATGTLIVLNSNELIPECKPFQKKPI
ncbi:hypothetical protein CEXT_180011 [Caerostris extrusa]|uniref:Uncharacterized protein n=1 Tax=Caerostris extrusa TaxID=172846 RepID=A0AAV4NJQ8_CAEEX|nr:hypothetical protein CEXT_180011 [Caerostris extrusa]